MSIVVSTYRTITCNTCSKTVTFEAKEEQKVAEENPWLKATRIVQNAQGRNFLYCSDQCELEGVAQGSHNPQEAPRISLAEGVSTMEAAARAAAAQEQATEAIKAGKPVTLQGR